MRTVVAVLAVALLAPAVALAAPKAGSYAGTTSGKVQGFRDDEPVTDKGTIRFKVAGAKATGLALKGQEFSCGGQRPEIDVKVGSIKLDAAGKGKATYTDEAVGAFAITLTVTSRGTATGTIVAKQLCKGTVRFTAKRK
jgi:hypothetical protein